MAARLLSMAAVLAAVLVGMALPCGTAAPGTGAAAPTSIPGLYVRAGDSELMTMLDHGSLAPALADATVAGEMLVVEFYASWCGHCQSFADTFRDAAQRLRCWRGVRVAVINCGDPVNTDACQRHDIKGFPTLKAFAPAASAAAAETGGAAVVLKAHTPAGLAEEVMQLLRNTPGPWMQALAPSLPAKLTFFQSLPSLHPALLAVVLQPAGSLLGPLLTMDYSAFIAADMQNTLAVIFVDDPPDTLRRAMALPALALFDKQGSLLSHASLPGGGTPASTPADPLEAQRQAACAAIDAALRPLASDAAAVERTARDHGLAASLAPQQPTARPVALPGDGSLPAPESFRHVSREDLVFAVSQSLRLEVALHSLLQGQTRAALLALLRLIRQHLPLSAAFVAAVDEPIRFLETHARVTSAQWQGFLLSWHMPGEPAPGTQPAWAQCRGSSPRFRGYPCGLWSLFHALVTTAERRGDAAAGGAALYAMRDYIKFFFGCRDCAEHFLRVAASLETDLHAAGDADGRATLWLWRAHNLANARLGSNPAEKSTDPFYPKRAFPLPAQCPACRADTDASARNASTLVWNRSALLAFLRSFYAVDAADAGQPPASVDAVADRRGHSRAAGSAALAPPSPPSPPSPPPPPEPRLPAMSSLLSLCVALNLVSAFFCCRMYGMRRQQLLADDRARKLAAPIPL